METIEFARQKDDILKCLLNHERQHVNSDIVRNELGPANISDSVFNECIDELEADGALIVTRMSGDRSILMITDKGKNIISSGGYSKRIEQELIKEAKSEYNYQKQMEKMDLEIADLKRRQEQYKYTNRNAIIAIIISALTFIYSIIK